MIPLKNKIINYRQIKEKLYNNVLIMDKLETNKFYSPESEGLKSFNIYY